MTETKLVYYFCDPIFLFFSINFFLDFPIIFHPAFMQMLFNLHAFFKEHHHYLDYGMCLASYILPAFTSKSIKHLFYYFATRIVECVRNCVYYAHSRVILASLRIL